MSVNRITTFACEHTDLLSESSSHTTRASCAATNVYGDTCRASAGYACQYHWHDFPTPITGPCGHIYGIHVKSSHARQASCPETNSNGDSCTVTDFYACQTHTHQYPAPTTVACGGNAWTGCTEQVSSESEHYVSSCSNCTAYLINTSLTSVDMPEAQNLNSFQHDIPNALQNAESLHTN